MRTPYCTNFRVARDTPKIALPVPVLSVIACLRQLTVSVQTSRAVLGDLFVLLHLAYSALARFRMGISRSPFFQSARKAGTAPSRLGFLQQNNVRIIVAAQYSETLSIRRQAE